MDTKGSLLFHDDGAMECDHCYYSVLVYSIRCHLISRALCFYGDDRLSSFADNSPIVEQFSVV